MCNTQPKGAGCGRWQSSPWRGSEKEPGERRALLSPGSANLWLKLKLNEELFSKPDVSKAVLQLCLRDVYPSGWKMSET